MKIELKNIQYSASLSQETNAFTAKLHINNVHAGFTSNTGHGGSTDYQAVDERGRELIRLAEDYCKSLPPEQFTLNDQEYTLDMDLESMIDNLLLQHLEQQGLSRFRKQVAKAIEQSIVIGIPDKSYRTLKFKMPIDMLLAYPNGKSVLTDVLKTRVIPSLKPDELIMNDNIPKDILKASGLKPQRYVAPVDEYLSDTPRPWENDDPGKPSIKRGR